jgi:hypothetical protein
MIATSLVEIVELTSVFKLSFFFSHGVLGLRNLLRALKQCSTPLVG